MSTTACNVTAADERAAEVALVCMPFYQAQTPPIASALLRAILMSRGVGCDVHHFNVTLADWDPVGYAEINSAIFFHGEWIFSQVLYDRELPRTVEGVESALAQLAITSRADGEAAGPKPLVTSNLPSARTAEGYAETVLRFLGHVQSFMDECIRSVDWGRYRIVGFTSTFQQNVASLALAKRLKALHPHLYIAFGGGNCDGALGETMFDAFPFIDGVCTGEGDVVFPALVEAYLAGAPPEPLAGFLDRRCIAPPKRVLPLAGALRPRVAKQPYVDLDTLPVPDFDPYFEQRARTRLHRCSLVLHFETSRGCWWGQKQHCTFCGVNGGNMQFRKKSAEVALRELRTLTERYGHHTRKFSATDNILPADYPRELLPRLADERLGIELFYEVKANLKRAELEQLRRAGITTIQPGIESLSTPILRLMNKGVTGIQNIRLLKLARQLGIKVHWNCLYGFPGEDPADYRGQAELWRKLHHLDPPMNFAPIRIDRFSPYHERPEDYGIENLRPHSAYARIYVGMTPSQLEGTAYIFVGDYESQHKVYAYAEELCEAARAWNEAASDTAMVMLDGEAGLAVGAIGPHDALVASLLTAEQRELYLACVDIRSTRDLAEHLTRAMGREVTAGEVTTLTEPLLAAGIMIAEGGRYLSLALSLHDDYFLPLRHWDRLSVLAKLADGSTAVARTRKPSGPPASFAAHPEELRP